MIITGANTGIGKETAIDLAKRGGKIYIACRDKRKSEEALKEIKYRSKSSKAFQLELDLASLDSINKFSRSFHELEPHLHILINNAGVMACPKSFTKDDFEMQLGTNHLGHFHLTNLLLDLLKVSTPSRVVVVSSSGHKLSGLMKDDLMGEKSYSKLKNYGQSKLANILFARELSKRLRGTQVTVNSCHPGIVQTELGRHMSSWLRPIYRRVLKPLYKTPIEGAQTQIRLAVDPELEKVSGKYFSNCEVTEPARHAQSDADAEWLWNKSNELIDEKLKKIN